MLRNKNMLQFKIECTSVQIENQVQKLSSLCQSLGSFYEYNYDGYLDFQEHLGYSLNILFEKSHFSDIFQEILDKNVIQYQILIPNADLWKEYIKPFKVEDLTIIPYSGKEIKKKYDVLIQNGEVFGTGHHETTKICITLLKKYPASSVLDLGCGTGILGISYLEYFPNVEIDFMDIDQSAVDLTKVNLSLNRHQGFCSTQLLDKSYELVLANILLDTLILYKEFFIQHKILILSGITRDQEKELLVHFPKFQVLEIVRLQDWSGCVLKNERFI